MSQLVPDPSAVADLAVRMTRLPWPSGAADRDRYFAELGLVDGGPAGAPEERSRYAVAEAHDPRFPVWSTQASASSDVSCSGST
jgi:hypothetical protein